ncbi:hypothetical protein ACH5RR_035536 [Cinchona calisaya]|uniref:Uncharacterized protein n=1 Tax=Cinchona calisaya TaxID=153742 RepID=A0ABD2Y0H6_9GENT
MDGTRLDSAVKQLPNLFKEARRKGMDCTCVDSAIKQLSMLLDKPHLTSSMENQIKALLLELRFVKLFFSLLPKLKTADQMESNSVFCIAEATTLEEAGKGLYQAGYFAIRGKLVRDWERVASNLLKTVNQFKPEFRRICVAVLLHSPLFHQEEEEFPILEFMDPVLVNLKRLVSSKADHMITAPPVKKQIVVLEKKLRFSRNFVDFSRRFCGRHEKFRDFLKLNQDWARNAACLSLLYWIDGMKVENSESQEMNSMLAEVVQKIMPYHHHPEVTKMYIEILKASEPPRSDALLMGEIVAGFVDNFTESPDKKEFMADDIEILSEELIFLIAFVMDPPKKKLGREGENANDAIISEVTSLIPLDCNISLHDFLEKISKIKTQVKKLYMDMPVLCDSNCPATNEVGFINFLLTNLEEMIECNPDFVLFAKHKIVKIHKELKSLMELRIEFEELEDLWMQIVIVAYRAQNVIHSCSISDSPIWHHIMCLSDVLKEIETIKKRVGEIMKDQTSSNREICAETNCRGIQPSRITTSRIDEVVVGFNDEATEVIGLLTGGSKQLSIVSIVGTSGVGKTTLAKKVYNDQKIQLNFTKFAWCSVSQVYRVRDLLLDILRCIASVKDDHICKLNDDQLEELVKKCLMKQKYLIVMDDIWDTRAWNAINESFPENKNGSRILLTSQIRDLDLHPNPSTYPLSILSDEKSWKFLEEMLFLKDGCPQNQLQVGKEIACKCGGLPLAVAAIAVLLGKEKENLDYWKQIEESLNLGFVNNGYRDILELIYKHLPDHLKPCCLYFGTFQVGKEISARMLTLLWIAEGFIQSTEKRSSEVVAKEYLMELINRSLVDVSKRSSDGGIKACCIHDLLHQFCVEKAKKEKFIHVDWPDHPHGSSTLGDPYRLCIHARWESFIQSKPIGLHVYSLLVSHKIRRNPSQLSSVASHFLHSLKLLKVLNLKSIYLHSDFPEEIMQIVHLRYLALRGGITKVPSSISILWNLRTFVVKGLESWICLPETIWKMKSLKHVHVSRKAVISLGDYELEESTQLNEIKTFSTLALHQVAQSEKVLRRLTGLRKLRCVVSESQLYDRKSIQFPGFDSLKNLESLTLSMNSFEGLTSYSRMHIQFQIFSFPLTLKKLTLHKLGLPWRAISKLWQLLNLEVLKLREQAFEGKLWDMEKEVVQFVNLKLLELSNLNIERWIVTTDAFPRLEQLVIRDCYGLEEIPSYFETIYWLKKIKLHRCSDETKISAKRIAEEQNNNNNEIELCIFHS